MENKLPFALDAFQKAYDKNPQAFCIVQVSKKGQEYGDIRFVYANPAYAKVSGFSLQRLIGHSYTELFGAPSGQWNTLYGDVAYGGQPHSLIVPGPEINAYVSVQCFQVAPGYCGSNVLDVTSEISATEKARAESRASWEQINTERTMYQTLLNQSSAMITVIDAESYQVLYANAAACKITKSLGMDYVGSVCYRSIAHGQEPCNGCILRDAQAPDEVVREIPFRDRTYRMVYRRIAWNGRKALMEYSEDITDQKQVVRLAEENARQHKDIIDNLPTGVIVFKIENHTYKVVQVNPAICKMMGIRPDDALEAIGEQILTLIEPADRDVVRGAAFKMAEPGVVTHYEFRSRVKDTGASIWIAAEGRSAVQPDGSIYVYIGYKDITLDKEKELAFQQKVDFISNLNDEFLISKGRHNLTQNRIISIEGKKQGAVVGRENGTYDELLPQLLKTAVSTEKRKELNELLNRENLLTAFAAGTREFAVSYRRIIEGDKLIWATLKGSLYEEPGTHDIIVFLYSYDSTEQTQESQIVNRLSTLEYGLLGLIDCQTCTFKTVHMKNVSPERVLNMHGDYAAMIRERCALPNILGDRDELLREMSLDTILAELEKRKIYDVDYSSVDPDGANRRMRFHYSYLDETKTTVMFFSSNITENYEKEQAQIRKIEKALHETQEANRAKSAFFSRMSHDMRTPMNGILGMTALSADVTDAAELQKNMQKIRESGLYLLSLINDTLDVQRIESGRMKLEPQIIGVREVVGNIIDMVKTAADSKGVTLRFDPGQADLSWYVRCDPVRIKQIFINLLSNAIKFTPRGGTVEFAARVVSHEGMISHSLFTICDTGIGMSREFLKNGIFEPFSQENNEVTANYAGSGLGLSIAKSLVELMGGTIAVESELGVGTTFTIHLDLERVDREKAETLRAKQVKKTRDLSAILDGKKLLLAEDHPLNAEITQKLLEKVGCSVTWAQNGRAALECFANSAPGSFDAILMDIRMPVMNGLEATKAIRALPRADAAQIPMIAMTANAYDEDVKKSFAAGMNAHLGKPVDPAVMYETLAQQFLPADALGAGGGGAVGGAGSADGGSGANGASGTNGASGAGGKP